MSNLVAKPRKRLQYRLAPFARVFPRKKKIPYGSIHIVLVKQTEEKK
jgi:hypothetical protein